MQKLEFNLQNQLFGNEITEKLLSIRYNFQSINKTVIGPEWNTSLFRKEYRITPYTRIYLPISGEGFGEIKTNVLHFRPGFIYLIPPFCNHHVTSKTRLEKYWIHFNAMLPDNQVDFFNQIDFPWELPVTSMTHTIENFEILLRLQGNYPYMKYQPVGIDAIEARAVLNQILIPFLRKAFPLNLHPDKKEKRTIDILYYIEQHLHEHITLQMLSEKFQLNPTYISNFFAKNINVSLIRYLNSRRIEKAFFALTNGTEPVKLIAAQLGFDDPLVFARLFKRHVGMTPAEYRKKQNSEKTRK